MSPACHEVPQAVMTIRSTCFSSSSRQVEAAEAGGALVVEQVAAERVAEALGLLVDLLQHEVRVAAPLDLRQVPVDLVHRLADARSSRGSAPGSRRG